MKLDGITDRLRSQWKHPLVNRSIGVGLVVLGLLVSVACTQQIAGADERCTPGAYVYCTCSDRTHGAKLCKQDAMTFEECLPCDGTGNTGANYQRNDGLGSRPTTSTTPTNTTDQDKDKTDTGSEDKKDGSASTAAKPTTPPPDAAHCKPLKNLAQKIEAQKLADEPNEPQGGKVKDGVYLQSWVIDFTGAKGESGPSKHYSRETLEIRGKLGRFTYEDDDGESKGSGFRLSEIEGEPAKVHVEYECQTTSEPRDLRFDATDTTLILYDDDNTARVFTWQQEAE